MNITENYIVKDISLAEQGMNNIELAEMQMKALLRVKERFEEQKPFEGVRIGMALHVTKETAVLVKTLIAGGAEVTICSCNPLSTQDDVAAALAEMGVKVFAYKGETADEYYEYLKKVIEFEPQITIDDGCDLVSEIHKNYPHLLETIIGGCEETTTGIIRLNSMVRDGALKYPVVAVNDNKTKHLMDNYYGTGQSTLDGIMRASNFLFSGKTAVVAGYGSCGKGVAMRLKGLGANVIVTEIESFRALQAVMDGFRVMTMLEAAKIGDIFITVTGNRDVITAEHVWVMKEGAQMANSGHFDLEIDLKRIEAVSESKRRVRPFMDEYVVNGKKVYILGEGRLVNLAAGEGHPSDIMSMSFCGQALACEFLMRYRGKLENEVHQLPENLDELIASMQLESMGVEIDVLTEEQREYLEGWQVGT